MPHPALGETLQYKAALEALNTIRSQHGSELREPLKVLAIYLFHSKESPAPASWFAWVGTGDDRDRAVVQAYEREFDRMVRGEDDDFD